MTTPGSPEITLEGLKANLHAHTLRWDTIVLEIDVYTKPTGALMTSIHEVDRLLKGTADDAILRITQFLDDAITSLKTARTALQDSSTKANNFINTQ